MGPDRRRFPMAGFRPAIAVPASSQRNRPKQSLRDESVCSHFQELTLSIRFGRRRSQDHQEGFFQSRLLPDLAQDCATVDSQEIPVGQTEVGPTRAFCGWSEPGQRVSPVLDRKSAGAGRSEARGPRELRRASSGAIRDARRYPPRKRDCGRVSLMAYPKPAQWWAG